MRKYVVALIGCGLLAASLVLAQDDLGLGLGGDVVKPEKPKHEKKAKVPVVLQDLTLEGRTNMESGVRGLLEVGSHDGLGYLPVIDFDAWRVAVLNGRPGASIASIETMNKHTETDEVFVLLRGRCLLFVASGSDAVEEIHARELEPYRLYNVKQAVWHAHFVTEDAKVLIVENRDTVSENSPGCPLSEAQQRRLAELEGELLGELTLP